MQDAFGRKINYLRVSVTDRCNLRCAYCMPPDGVADKGHDKIMHYEQIIEFVKTAISMGINKIRLTGGEPLVRKNILYLVESIANLQGLDELCMTTNGILLDKFAQPLRDAGLDRINISLDTLCPDHYTKLTNGGDVKNVIAGIKAAQNAGFAPIKLNCVVQKTSPQDHAQDVAKFAAKNGLIVRFIQQMNIQTGDFGIVQGGDGGNCSICNRLRLSSDGYLRPCLFNDTKFDISQYKYEDVIKLALENKPQKGTLSLNNKMHHIGG